MKLLIGNKTYSSWSLRPWLLMRHAEIPFEEELISFNDDAFDARVKKHSPVGKVPVLVDDDVVVWDSLAICEYVAEQFPDRRLWPEDRAARALARSLSAEMHSGFQALRSAMPMNLRARFPGGLWTVAVQRDVARIVEAWANARRRFGSDGPFLFGRFSVADAYFAPVTRRFVTYGVSLPDEAARYVETIGALPAMRYWADAALAERDFVEEDEPYRTGP